jgi:hypothetical protein
MASHFATCLRRRRPRHADLITMIDLSQGLKHMLTLVWEAGHGIDEVPPRMDQAVGQHDAEALRHIAGEGIAHLDGRLQAPSSLFEDIRHVLPGMFSSSEKERNAMSVVVVITHWVGEWLGSMAQ